MCVCVWRRRICSILSVCDCWTYVSFLCFISVLYLKICLLRWHARFAHTCARVCMFNVHMKYINFTNCWAFVTSIYVLNVFICSFAELFCPIFFRYVFSFFFFFIILCMYKSKILSFFAFVPILLLLLLLLYRFYLLISVRCLLFYIQTYR